MYPQPVLQFLDMEECKTHDKKRSRDESGLDSVFDSPESKRVHTEPNASPSSIESEVNPSSSKFDETDEDVDVNSSEAKQIREDILDILDEPETVTDDVPEVHDLDSLIKSFEEEIIHPHQTVIDLTLTDSGDSSQSDLGYLLEASDDELGLPPTVSPTNHIDAESDAALLTNTIGFENELLRYDSFDLVMLAGIMDGDSYGSENDGDFFTVGGLFDYPNPSESLPSL
ncbi:hypothetical protein K7X08_022458 [Anisodus acutangulus]|uniref:Uncharacterized protein n=1 Tax=Anisodus acutangulus TaxID=402998 RepID=A0A9Q1ML75_9SOLA|nr:hypothetical protein K7X08_022458 [Anisodus acutangulus]